MKTLKLSLIVAAVLVPFTLATAATDTPKHKFTDAKTPLAVVGQASADATNAAAVVDVVGIFPEQPAGILDTIKTKVTGKKPTVQELHSVGVYVGKGLVLSDNGVFAASGKYRVTLADGRSIDATMQREGGGLLLLRLGQVDNLPKPVTVATARPSTGDDVTVYGLFDVYGGPRHTVMARGYVSAQAISFYSDQKAPTLVAIKTDRDEPKTAFGPVFLRGQLVGVSVLSQYGETYVVPADFFAPRLAKVFAEI